MSLRTHLRFDMEMTGCGRDLTGDITDNPKHVTCRSCIKQTDDFYFKGKGKLKCGVCRRPYRDHHITEWHTR